MDWLKVMFVEHGVISRVASCMCIYSQTIQAGVDVPQETTAELLDTLHNFADRCHHGKEERALFPLLRKKLPEPEAIDMLLKEHEMGRKYVHDMTIDGKRAAARDSMKYALLLPLHIGKENTLFARCDKLLDNDERDMLETEFGAIEREAIGTGTYAVYLKKVEKIGKTLKELRPASCSP